MSNLEAAVLLLERKMVAWIRVVTVEVESRAQILDCFED